MLKPEKWRLGRCFDEGRGEERGEGPCQALSAEGLDPAPRLVFAASAGGGGERGRESAGAAIWRRLRRVADPGAGRGCVAE